MAVELTVEMAPDEFFEAMIEQLEPEEIADLIIQIPKLIKDKKFVSDIHDMYGKILKIYEEAGM